jgi:DNA (cytosine-5)-methyltransferase 1
MSLTIGSLFSGIGGLELGLERAGLGPVVWQVECDPFALQVLEKHWPDAERYQDVRSVCAELAPVSVICGGFPCQDISNAGKREGIEGKRSGLWSEFARIVGVVRPRFVVVENVSALLGRGMGVVLGDLAALGYDATWDCIPAQAIGAPHRRDRLFVVAWRVPDTKRDGIREQSERGNGCPQEADSGNAEFEHLGSNREDVAHHHHRLQGIWQRGLQHVQRKTQRDNVDGCGDEAVDANTHGEQKNMGHSSGVRSKRVREKVGEIAKTGGKERNAEFARGGCFPPSPSDLHAWRQVQADAQPSVCGLADGIPADVLRDRAAKLKAYGNAVVPQVAEVIGYVVREIANEQ